jgi:hypothetical protein
MDSPTALEMHGPTELEELDQTRTRCIHWLHLSWTSKRQSRFSHKLHLTSIQQLHLAFIQQLHFTWIRKLHLTFMSTLHLIVIQPLHLTFILKLHLALIHCRSSMLTALANLHSVTEVESPPPVCMSDRHAAMRQPLPPNPDVYATACNWLSDFWHSQMECLHLWASSNRSRLTNHSRRRRSGECSTTQISSMALGTHLSSASRRSE